MFHAGLALELSRIIWDDRRAEARAGRGRSKGGRSVRGGSVRGGSGRTFVRMRQETAPARVGIAASLTSVEDPWRWWRVVEPDAEYLRRRAA
jgi:hypothetical protein